MQAVFVALEGYLPEVVREVVSVEMLSGPPRLSPSGSDKTPLQQGTALSASKMQKSGYGFMLVITPQLCQGARFDS
jgi:hypothetical protein